MATNEPGNSDAKPADRHFVCEECFAGHVMSAVDADSIATFGERGGITCVQPGCCARPFSDGALAKVLPDDTFCKYVTAKERLTEQRINVELEAGFSERLRVERERAGAADRETIKQ